MTKAFTDVRDQVADRYDSAADELERAAAHLRTAAGHLRDRAVPRGCAHGWSAHGHIVTARQQMDDNAVVHASRTQPWKPIYESLDRQSWYLLTATVSLGGRFPR